ESLDWENKDLTIQGAGTSLSVIDPGTAGGGPGGRCMYTLNLTTASQIRGFTLQNGTIDGDGGGMYNLTSSPLLINCNFSGNSATITDKPDIHSGNGGGMYNLSSSPILVNCIFSGNTAVFGGAMENATDSHPT